MKIFLQHSSRENHWDQVSPWRQCQGRREGVSSGSAETSAPFRAGTGPSEMAREGMESLQGQVQVEMRVWKQVMEVR